MKKIINILFASILAISLANFAQAGEMTVTGSAQATYTITSSDSASGAAEATPALGMSNELTFGATGEFGNGYTWNYQIDIDPASGASGAALNDDTRIELGLGDLGTIGIYNSEGDLNTHLSNSVAAYAPGHDIGSTGSYTGGTGINSYNNIQYHTPAGLLPFGTSVKLAWSNGDNAQSADANDQGSGSKKNVTSYQVTTKPIDGLTVGASYLEKQDSGSATLQKYETGGAYAKYSIGAFSFGIGRHYVAPNTNSATSTTIAKTDALYTSTANTATYAAANNAASTLNGGVEYFKNDAVSVAFAVNESLSISYDQLTSFARVKQVDADARADVNVDRELEITSIQAAYNIGGAVVAVGQKSIDGVGYAQNRNQKETVVSLKMAF